MLFICYGLIERTGFKAMYILDRLHTPLLGTTDEMETGTSSLKKNSRIGEIRVEKCHVV
jgi:hypothetical protein